MSAPRPNLFIIGAMKCGTSSLHAYLGAHPAIFMSPVKEPDHFVDRETLHLIWPPLVHRGYWRAEKYLALFRAAGDATIIGESSTNYSKLPLTRGVPQRIAAFNPDARIIYMIRDPLLRTISHYWHLARRQRERRDMLAAFREDPHYIDVSNYAMQLQPYLDVFGPERVKTVVTEELAADSLGTVHEIFRWLGVDSGFVPPNLARREHVAPERFEEARTLQLLERFRRTWLWSKLTRAVPAGPKWAVLRLLSKRRAVEIAASPPAEVVDYLRPILIAQTKQLGDLLGRDFAVWTALSGSETAAAAGSQKGDSPSLSEQRSGAGG